MSVFGEQLTVHCRAGQGKTMCGLGSGQRYGLFSAGIEVERPEDFCRFRLIRSDLWVVDESGRELAMSRTCRECERVIRVCLEQECPPLWSLFGYSGSNYRLTGYLLARPPAPDPGLGAPLGAILGSIIEQSSYQRDGMVMQDCCREDATHVSGAGVAGCIAPIGHIQVTGSVLGRGSWTAERLAREEQRAVEMAKRGEVVF